MPDEPSPSPVATPWGLSPELRRPILWVLTEAGEKSPENWIVYKASADGAHWAIRMNDFPAEPLYTLLINEEPIIDFNQWPTCWSKPA